MMLASLEPETFAGLVLCVLRHGTREALGWRCTGLGVTVAGRAASVLRHARRTGSQAYFVLDVLVVSVFGGGGGGRGGAGYVWTVYEMACFLFHVQGTSFCDHAATSSAVLYRFSYDVGVVPQLSSSTVWTVYEMACFLCFLCCAQRQVPTVLSFWQGSVCCSTLTRSSMSWERGCSIEACERISHFFHVLLALFAWNLDVIS